LNPRESAVAIRFRTEDQAFICPAQAPRSDNFAGRNYDRTGPNLHFATTKDIMKRVLISSGSTFESEFGYSRAVVQGDWVFVSGTTGFDYSNMTIADDLETQAEQCLKNIASALEQAGSSMNDVVRVTYVLPDATEFAKCGPALRRYFGVVRPAAMMISAGLADPRMKIEIEVTALKLAQ
jgi:enamine deaminase RidA (YjgF/YER057c/UK114 family)